MGHLWVVSAASGTGKTSLVKALLAQDSMIQVAISHTTRQPRAGEINGIDYHFVTRETFKSLLAQDVFIEHADVYGHFYGTSKQSVTGVLDNGQDVILEIDWQGAAQIQSIMPQAKSIFIFPPSHAQLRLRLETRGKDQPEIIDQRLSEARLEMTKSDAFDYWLINDQFEPTLLAFGSIIEAHRYEKGIMKQRYPDLIRGLCGPETKF